MRNSNNTGAQRWRRFGQGALTPLKQGRVIVSKGVIVINILGTMVQTAVRDPARNVHNRSDVALQR